MRAEHFEYLAQIGATKVARERAATLWGYVSSMAPAELKSVYMCDLFVEEGVRAYSNIWFFTDKYYSECRNFIENTHFDYTSLKEVPRWVDVSAVNYDFHQAGDTSSMRVEGRLGENTAFTLTAVRNNCDHLKALISNYFVPFAA
ncbi:hypothetical protein [Brevundimonas sp. DC300-4]|uniref:hypothetical protein n=1 Tax=Brevundimonas sp. DC300-4 TaxID=2804594 RepID=UPI003CEDC8D6